MSSWTLDRFNMTVGIKTALKTNNVNRNYFDNFIMKFLNKSDLGKYILKEKQHISTRNSKNWVYSPTVMLVFIFL